MNIGSSNRPIYDNCQYMKQLSESTSPLLYRLYEGQYEVCSKCKKDVFIKRYDLVDVESELRNITRVKSKCDQFQYNPTCKKSDTCTSTFDDSNLIVYPPEICPIVHNNIQKMTTPGYELPEIQICSNKIIEKNNIKIEKKN